MLLNTTSDQNGPWKSPPRSCHPMWMAGWRTAVSSVVIVVVVTGAGVPAPLRTEGTAHAKEHAAACTEVPAFIVRVRAAAEAAMFHRNRGSSLAAYQILRSTSASLAREATRGECGALGNTVTSALRRAASTATALEAGAELDLGLEAAMALAINGRPPALSSPAKLPPVPESSVYGAGCPDLFQIVLRLDGPPEGLASRVRTVVVDLRDRPRCDRLRSLLEAVKPEQLLHAVDSV